MRFLSGGIGFLETVMKYRACAQNTPQKLLAFDHYSGLSATAPTRPKN
jgi:hypothetical protein